MQKNQTEVCDQLKFFEHLASRTRFELALAAVKQKRITVIQWNLAAWLALYRIWRSHGNASELLMTSHFCVVCAFAGWTRRLTLCHKGTAIEVNKSALEAHLAHGDTGGSCP
jgi:hypothetical protein